MRFSFFLVVFFIGCCSSLAGAEKLTKDTTFDTNPAVAVSDPHMNLQDAVHEERGFRGLDKLKNIFQTNMAKTGTVQKNSATMKELETLQKNPAGAKGLDNSQKNPGVVENLKSMKNNPEVVKSLQRDSTKKSIKTVRGYLAGTQTRDSSKAVLIFPAVFIGVVGVLGLITLIQCLTKKS